MPFDLADRRIILAVKDWESLKAFGFTGPICYVKVVDKDATGVWIENVDWPMKPAGKDAEEFDSIHLLIPWHNVTALGLFPKERPMSHSGRVRSIA